LGHAGGFFGSKPHQVMKLVWDSVKHNFCARISDCLLLFPSLKSTRKLLDRFGDANQFGMARTDTGERFPIGLQGFTKLRTASDSAINEHLHSFEMLNVPKPKTDQVRREPQESMCYEGFQKIR